MSDVRYIDRNNEHWSIEKGDWLGFQYEEEKINKSKGNRKKILLALLLFPILILLTTITVINF